MIKQNIVFIENKAGSLQKVTGLLAEAGIDIYGFACFDAPEFSACLPMLRSPKRFSSARTS